MKEQNQKLKRKSKRKEYKKKHRALCENQKLNEFDHELIRIYNSNHSKKHGGINS